MLPKSCFLILLLYFFVGCTNQPLNNSKQTEYRAALVIANGNYPMQGWTVNEVKVDAEKLVKTLQKRNFHVIYVTDANLDLMQKSIEEFKKLVKRNKNNLQDTIALVYFVGHGISSNEEQSTAEDYLVPILNLEDIQNVKDVKSLLFKVDEFDKLVKEFNNFKIKANLFIINACRSNDLHALNTVTLPANNNALKINEKYLAVPNNNFSRQEEENKREYTLPNTITIAAKQSTRLNATGDYALAASLSRHLETPNLTLAQLTNQVVDEVNKYYKTESEKEFQKNYNACMLEKNNNILCTQKVNLIQGQLGLILSKSNLIDTSLNNLILYPYTNTSAGGASPP